MVTWDEWAKNVNEQLRTITKAIDDFVNDLSALEKELVEAIFLERMQVHIVESLKKKNLTQREIMKTSHFMEHRLHRDAFYMAWNGFEKAGVILPISQGRGHARTWRIGCLPAGYPVGPVEYSSTPISLVKRG